MGIVRMGSNGTLKFKGTYSTQLVYCLYCDKCGSFKIGRRINRKNLMWIFVIFIIAFLLLYSSQNIMSLLLLFWVFLFIHPLGAFDLEYKCKKCGNWNISLSNTLNYKECDRGLLDVPYKSTKKKYKWDY